jgi:hypothetical protein
LLIDGNQTPTPHRKSASLSQPSPLMRRTTYCDVHECHLSLTLDQIVASSAKELMMLLEMAFRNGYRSCNAARYTGFGENERKASKDMEIRNWMTLNEGNRPDDKVVL